MPRFLFPLLAIVLALGTGSSVAGRTPRTDAVPSGGTHAIRPVVPDRPVGWQSGSGGNQIPLWPDGTTLQRPESDRPEMVGSGSRPVAGRPWTFATYVSRPTMTIYRPRGSGTRATMLVLPGGGYEAVAMDLEGTEICDWVTARGMTCVVLKYRVPQRWHRDHVEVAPAVQLPVQDAQRAMSLLRSRAALLGIDPHRIGVIGFSAGGHLAAAISNAARPDYAPVDAADRQPFRPDFAILLYPGHLWDGTAPRSSLVLSPWNTISPTAPPTLLIHAMDDRSDDVRNSMAYGLALHDAGVSVEMHLYAEGGHAFGLRPTSAPITTAWPGLVLKWLHAIKVL